MKLQSIIRLMRNVNMQDVTDRKWISALLNNRISADTEIATVREFINKWNDIIPRYMVSPAFRMDYAVISRAKDDYMLAHCRITRHVFFIRDAEIALTANFENVVVNGISETVLENYRRAISGDYSLRLMHNSLTVPVMGMTAPYISSDLARRNGYMSCPHCGVYFHSSNHIGLYLGYCSKDHYIAANPPAPYMPIFQVLARVRAGYAVGYRYSPSEYIMEALRDWFDGVAAYGLSDSERDTLRERLENVITNRIGATYALALCEISDTLCREDDMVTYLDNYGIECRASDSAISNGDYYWGLHGSEEMYIHNSQAVPLANGDIISRETYDDGDYFRCTDCHDIFHIDDSNHVGNNSVLCPDCFDNYEPPCIYEYKTDVKKHYDIQLDAGVRYFGVELETEAKRVRRDDLASGLQGVIHDFALCKSDCSISGVEIVSIPAEYHVHLEKWKPILARLNDLDATNGTSTGLHIHISRDTFSPLLLAKFIGFINYGRNYDFITCIAQRRENGHTKLKPLMNPWKKTKRDNDYDRFEAVNITNRHTIELRIFRARFNERDFFKCLQFTDSLLKYLETCSASSLHYSGYLVWLERNNAMRDYPELMAFIAASTYAI